MADGQPVPGSLFVYAPNKVAPVVFSVAFCASAIGHLWQCIRYRCFKLVGLHPLCAIIFAAGYGLREYGAFNYMYSNRNLIIYILSQVFIFICPPLLELANYHVLGRLFHYVPYFAPFPSRKVFSLFGSLMGLVEALNSLGVSFAANPSTSQSHQDMGKHLIIAAIAIQLCVIVAFVIMAAIFHRRCANGNIRVKAVSTNLLTLYASMFLIFIRCIYRLVEHLGNTTVQLDDVDSLRSLSPILRYEWFFYVFEATLMFLNSVLWNIWNPGRHLPKNRNVYLAEDGQTELEGEEEQDDRPLLAMAGLFLTLGMGLGRKRGTRRPMELRRFPIASRRAGRAGRGG